MQRRRVPDAPAPSLDSVLVDRIFSACLLDDPTPAQNTSVRLPGRLHGAALATVGSGAAGSLSEIIIEGVRLHLLSLAESAATEQQVGDTRLALEEHYAEFPDARPSLSEIVTAAAVMGGHQAAEHPALIADAIEDLGDDADVEDILASVRGALAQR